MNRCSQCWKYGHNKRTCPKITERYQVMYDRAVADNDRHDINYWAENLAKRTGTDPRNGKKVNRRPGIVRRCSYCKYVHGSYCSEGVGHTRRTCKYLKKDKSNELKKNAKYRKEVITAMKREGVGVGAVVNILTSAYYSDGNGGQVYESRMMPHLITKVIWDRVCDCKGPYTMPLELRRLDQLGKSARECRSRHLTLPKLHKGYPKNQEITSFNGHSTGDWTLTHSDSWGDDAELIARCPRNGLDGIPLDYYRGYSKTTDEWFSEKKR